VKICPSTKNALLTLALCLGGTSIPLMAQIFGFKIPANKKKVELPFQFKNGFIILDLEFDHKVPMKFIFDTGAEYTILTKKEIPEILGLEYSKEYRIMGSDMKTELTAYLTRGVSFRYKDFEAYRQDIFILKEDYFRFDEFTGLNIYGIIGANFFRNLVLEINYKKQIITFYRPDEFKIQKRSGFSAFDISVYRGKPYLNCELEILDGQVLPVKLLIDTGASLGLLLHTDSTGILKTPNNAIAGPIGNGLGGQLKGFLGRINRLQLKEFQFDSFITSFQEINETLDTSLLNNRNGLIGNTLLSRFHLIIDYVHHKMYLKSIPKYNKGFEYDRSGLNLIADGAFLEDFVVQNVMEGSPADLAGVKKGDRLVSFNHLGAKFFSLSRLHALLRKKPGKKIRLKIKRGEDKIVLKFQLKDLV